MNSFLAAPQKTKAVLRSYGLFAKHRLGQNFLVSDAVIGHILDFAALDPGDVVLEIGPGIGTLTCALLPHVKGVCAIEADKSLIPVLDETCCEHADKLALLFRDALKVERREIELALREAGIKQAPTAFVSNLPYQIAATSILRYLQLFCEIDRAVVMVQKEVADRIGAHPGSKNYGAYTVKLSLLAAVSGRFEVSKASFMPAPHVDSSVLLLKRRQLCNPDTGQSLSAAAQKQVASVVDAAFSQRRKTLLNSMAHSAYKKADIMAACADAGIDPTLRAESLRPEDFIRLAAALNCALSDEG